VPANADTDSHTFSYPNSYTDTNGHIHFHAQSDTDTENCSNAKVAAYPSAAPVAALKETASSDS